MSRAVYNLWKNGENVIVKAWNRFPQLAVKKMIFTSLCVKPAIFTHFVHNKLHKLLTTDFYFLPLLNNHLSTVSTALLL